MWFFYDDTSSRRMITLIGSYENLINIKHVLTNGTLFFYTNIKDKPVSIYSGFKKIKNKPDKWVIFTLKDINCSACSNTKKLLKKHNIKFTEKLISNKKINYVQNKLDKYTKKYRYFPMIFKNNKFIGGYDKLEKIFK
jgi:glutaredoxin